MADSQTKGNNLEARHSGKPPHKKQGQSAKGKFKKSRIDPYRRKTETVERDGKRVLQRATPPREIIRRLACDLAIELMEYDREVTTVPLPEAAQTPKKKTYAIMGWLSGETENQTTAAMRFIEACANGPTRIHPETGENAVLDYSALTEFQLDGLRAAFMVICLSEERRVDGVLNQGYDVLLPVMEEDWYTNGIDEISKILTEVGGVTGLAFKAWTEEHRKSELLRLTAEQRAERDNAILAAIDTS